MAKSNILKINKTLEITNQFLFRNGWGFISPYLLFYLYSWYFQTDIILTENVFIGIHIVTAILAVLYLKVKLENINKYSKLDITLEILFWFALWLIFLLPRAYLEFPSDPWEHFRRIFEFSSKTFLAQNTSENKFTYFWGWTLLKNIPPLSRRFWLDIYSAFWQILLAYQFYRLALRLGCSQTWSKVQAVGATFLLGTNLFSFRYYALSSTPLAHIAYLAAVIVLIDFKEGRKKNLFLLLPLLLIMFYNHRQTLILLFISSVALLFDYLTNTKQKTKWFIGSSIAIFTASLAWGNFAVSHPQAISSKPWNSSLPYMSSLGTFRIWDWQLPYFETCGLHGLLGLILAIVFMKKYKTISWLTLTPYILLLFPPFVINFAITQPYSDNYVTYRALFAFPTSFMLVLGIKELTYLLLNKVSHYLAGLPSIPILLTLLIIIIIPPQYPYRGRFWFQVYKPPAELSLKYLDVTGQWFYENRHLDNQCMLLSDRATMFFLQNHFGLRGTDRFYPLNVSQNFPNLASLKNFISTNKVCQLLVQIPNQTPPIPLSKVAELSKHWGANNIQENFKMTPEFVKMVDDLQKEGWSKTFVPPFYWLYQAPAPKNNVD